jgi:hypothetical protein
MKDIKVNFVMEPLYGTSRSMVENLENSKVKDNVVASYYNYYKKFRPLVIKKYGEGEKIEEMDKLFQEDLNSFNTGRTKALIGTDFQKYAYIFKG